MADIKPHLTYIDYFVIAYYTDKKKTWNYIVRVINEVNNNYRKARLEYNCMKDLFTVDELTEWIRERLTGRRLAYFNQDYPKT